MTSHRILEAARRETTNLEELVENLPGLLDGLRKSYGELEERALYVEEELSRANRTLEEKVCELDALKRHLEAVLESLPCGVVVRDACGTIVRANDAASSLLGVRARDLIGRDGAGANEGLLGEAAVGEPRELRRADGRRLVLANRFSLVHTETGDIDGSVEILDDRTERAALEERLHVADKLAALGTLTAGVAHELRNPLNAVKGFASMLRRQNFEDVRLTRWAGFIVEGVDEVDAIIDNMLSLGSPTRLRLEEVDGQDLIEGALRLVRSETEDAPEFEFHAEAPTFLADRIKLRQATRNLVANALEAQTEGPRIDVSLALEDGDIVIRVGDAGPGVPSELRSRILDPFFTTNADGTGLGLPLVAVIARLHGGELQLAPEPSRLGGAEFLIRFPFRPADSARAGFPQRQ